MKNAQLCMKDATLVPFDPAVDNYLEAAGCTEFYLEETSPGNVRSVLK